MLKFYTITWFFTLAIITNVCIAQDSWKKQLEPSLGFIVNEGQFDRPESKDFVSKVKYAFDGFTEDYFFMKEGVVFEFNKRSKRVKTDAEKAARKQRKLEGFTSLSDWQDFEEEGTEMVVQSERISAIWLNTNPNVKIKSYDQNSFYHNYGMIDSRGEEVFKDHIPSYKKLVYENLYDNIDVIYEIHPISGVKYSLVLKPGADLSRVRLKYSKTPRLLPNGDLTFETMNGEMIDHAPVSFYEKNNENIIASSFKLNGNTVSFELAEWNKNETLVIDPWTQTPAYNTNWDCVWEVETDAAGNTYTIGGVMPLMLTKYDAVGAQQWTFTTTYDSTEWLGTFAVDDAGNSYVTNGSTARIRKHFTTGAVDWSNPSPGGLFTSTEFWNIAFNCDQTRLIIGGTGGSIPPLPYIYDVDMTNGNILSSVQVTGSSIAGIPPNTQEVRSITATANEKYYFLTHDSIGYVNQDLSICPEIPGNSTSFVFNVFDQSL